LLIALACFLFKGPGTDLTRDFVPKLPEYKAVSDRLRRGGRNAAVWRAKSTSYARTGATSIAEMRAITAVPPVGL
jgi:hypothetical protein